MGLKRRRMLLRQALVQSFYDQRKFHQVVLGVAARAESATTRVFQSADRRPDRMWFHTLLHRVEKIIAKADVSRPMDARLPASVAWMKNIVVHRQRVEMGSMSVAADAPFAARGNSLRPPSSREVFTVFNTPLTLAPKHAAATHRPQESGEAAHQKNTTGGRIATESKAIKRTALPDNELERITERVIDSIDRRIVADRERLGRI
jgi:hypothetical protein